MITRRSFAILCVSTLLAHRQWEANSVSDASSTTTTRAGDSSVETTDVLIVRTIFSPSEIENALADAARIISYQEYPLEYHLKSLSQCHRLVNSTEIDPFASNRSEIFPNRILCDVNRKHENYYSSVRANFLFFVRREDMDEITSTKTVRDHTERIEAVDVSENTAKIWNWMYRLTESQLIGYDYVWLVDGDMLLTSLNWHAYWQQVKLFRPKVNQPSIIGNGLGMLDSYHPILRHQKDSRILAAETAMVEVMAPLFEVRTWLGYREMIADEPLIWNLIKAGGQNCLDVAWCHYAKANLTGSQEMPQIHAGERISYISSSSTYSTGDNFTHGEFKDRSCVILYQTPLVHGDKKAMGKKTLEYRNIGARLRDHLGVYKIIDVASAGRNVYDIFVAS